MSFTALRPPSRIVLGTLPVALSVHRSEDPVVEKSTEGRISFLQREGNPIYMIQMARGQTESALTLEKKRFAWTLIDYETEDFRGRLISAGIEYPTFCNTVI